MSAAERLALWRRHWRVLAPSYIFLAWGLDRLDHLRDVVPARAMTPTSTSSWGRNTISCTPRWC